MTGRLSPPVGLRYNAGAPTTQRLAFAREQPGLRADKEYGGASGLPTGVLAGTVTVLTAPAQRHVRVLDRKSSLVVASGRSKPDGSYRFTGLRTDIDYVVIAFDDTPGATYNAVIADRIRAVVES